jgi:putative RecB family exonuclease
MVNYSNSKLDTFKQCKYKYKLRYIDKIKPEIKTSIEAFMGSVVHETLYKLYGDLKKGFFNTRDKLIEFYDQEWEKEWDDTINIVRNDKEFYRNRGKDFVISYYDRFTPFNQVEIIDLETEDFLDLRNGNKYHVRIDKLCKDKNNNFFVCDYKTNNRLKTQNEVDKDRQLAMYSLWVKDHFKDANNIKLVWNFLAFNTEMVSERDDFVLTRLKNEIENEIDDIEKCEDFPPNQGILCDWCEYKKQCIMFK